MSEQIEEQVYDVAHETKEISSKEISVDEKKYAASSRLRVGLTALFVVALGFLGGWPLLLMIGAFAVSIIVHEFGHFLVAKRAGMKATEFFIGFGPKIFSFTRGETEYGLKAIPAGAYVRIIGMSNLETVSPEDEARTYRAQPYRWRLATVLAGPFANILLAFVILVGFYAATPQRDVSDWRIQSIAVNSTAEDIGILSGERIVAVDGVSTVNYDDLTTIIAASGGQEKIFTVEAVDGETRDVRATMGWRLSEGGEKLFSPLQENDVVTYVNGNEVSSVADFASKVSAIPVGKTFSVQFFRADGVYEARVVKPDVETNTLESGSFAKGYAGIAPTFEKRTLSPIEAIGQAGSTVFTMGKSSVEAIFTFFSPSGLMAFGERVVSPVAVEPQSADNNITVLVAPSTGSPTVSSADENRVLSIVGVVRLGAQAAEANILQFILLWVVINIFLAVVNLLPLLPLDGGHAAVATWEKIRGLVTKNSAYRVSMEKLLPVSYAVIAIFIVVGLSAMWLDITSPIENPF